MQLGGVGWKCRLSVADAENHIRKAKEMAIKHPLPQKDKPALIIIAPYLTSPSSCITPRVA